MKTLLLLFFLPVGSHISYRELTWNDFRGRPSGPHAAMTHCGIYVHTTEVNDVVVKQWAEAYFDTQKSWTRTKSPVALLHEQGHFAISKIYAAQLKTGMNADSLLAVYQNVQVEYDEQTEHGINNEMQKQWQRTLKY